MRTLLILLALAGVVFAPYDDVIQCEKSCCSNYGGDWDSEYEYCDISYGDSSYESFESCSDRCWEGYTGSSCCGPAFMLLALLGSVIIR